MHLNLMYRAPFGMSNGTTRLENKGWQRAKRIRQGFSGLGRQKMGASCTVQGYPQTLKFSPTCAFQPWAVLADMGSIE